MPMLFDADDARGREGRRPALRARILFGEEEAIKQDSPLSSVERAHAYRIETNAIQQLRRCYYIYNLNIILSSFSFHIKQEKRETHVVL